MMALAGPWLTFAWSSQYSNCLDSSGPIKMGYIHSNIKHCSESGQRHWEIIALSGIILRMFIITGINVPTSSVEGPSYWHRTITPEIVKKKLTTKPSNPGVIFIAMIKLTDSH